LAVWTASAQQLDVVLKGGRVVDPETGLDAIRDVGIQGDRIVRISAEPLDGRRVLDVRGLVVAPGFIDLHQHTHETATYRLKALDGVTTALEMETGVPDVARFIEERRGKTLIHFGTTASQRAARIVAWGEALAPSREGPYAAVEPPAGPSATAPSSPERLGLILTQLRAGLRAGALGIGIGIEYTPGASRGEIIEVFRLAAEYRVPVFVHVRSAGQVEPGSSIESVGEMIAASAVTGAPVHIVHLNGSCMAAAPECLRMVEGARGRGLDVTTEAYPYGAGMTAIGSALFNPGWRERRGLDYSNIELPESGERLTRERFDALRALPEPRNVLIHMNPDALVDAIVRHPLVMIGSDGMRTHPRNAGTYARVLARYVREQGSLTLLDAVRKMSLMPAQRLQGASTAARRKGRLQPGADADVVVFDPGSIQDNATYRAAGMPSTGVRYLLVAGTLVVDEGRIVDGVAPGRPLVGDGIVK
jgi:hypothetical protein